MFYMDKGLSEVMETSITMATAFIVATANKNSHSSIVKALLKEIGKMLAQIKAD